MKLIIEIPEETYNFLKRYGTDGGICENSVINGTPLNEYIDMAFDDLNKCKCGSSYIIIDGETYYTDTGYAFEGIELFTNYIKGTLSKEKLEG